MQLRRTQHTQLAPLTLALAAVLPQQLVAAPNAHGATATVDAAHWLRRLQFVRGEEVCRKPKKRKMQHENGNVLPHRQCEPATWVASKDIADSLKGEGSTGIKGMYVLNNILAIEFKTILRSKYFISIKRIAQSSQNQSMFGYNLYKEFQEFF